MVPLAKSAGEKGIEVGWMVESLLVKTIAPCSAVAWSENFLGVKVYKLVVDLV